MKKLWFHSLAIALSFIGTNAFGQYPNANNFGPSSYPIQTNGVPTHSILGNLPQVPQGYNAHAAPAPNLVGPNNGQYQLVGAQEQIYGQPEVQGFAPPTAQAPMHPAPAVNHPAMNAPANGQAFMNGAHGNPVPQNGVPMNVQPTMQAPASPSAAMGCQGCNQAMLPYSAPGYAPQMGYTVPQGGSIAPNCTSCGPAPVSQGYNYAPIGSVAAAPAVAKPWFFGANALVFNRIDSKNVPLSLADAAYNPDILGTRDARHGAAAGFEVTAGRYINCGRHAIAATYWGVFPSDQEALRARSTAGDYRSRIPFTYMTMAGTPGAPGTPYPVYDWFDAAYTHTLQRSSEYHNAEINLLGWAVGGASRNFNRSTAGSMFSRLGRRHGNGCGFCGGAGCGSCGGASASACNSCKPAKYATGPCCLRAPACGSRMNVTWLAGLRYFRFTDNLLYAASLDDTVINRGADDLYYEVNTTNDLIGFQLGSRMDYCLGKRFNLYGTAKAGIYNNRSTMFTRLGTDFDYAYLADTRTPANPNNGQDYLFDETKNQVAFLSELGTGLGVRVSCKWTATFGYRAVIASGVANAPENVRGAFANYDDIRNFDNYGTLVLHGFNAGAVYNY